MPKKQTEPVRKIYVAFAEQPDGNRIFDRAYLSYEQAEVAAIAMVKDIRKHTDWEVIPVVEDMDLVLTEPGFAQATPIEPESENE